VEERRSLSCPVVYMMKSTSTCQPCLALPSKPQQQTPTTSAAWPAPRATQKRFLSCERKSVEHAIITNITSKIGSRARPASL